jgi:hypothetical protein
LLITKSESVAPPLFPRRGTFYETLWKKAMKKVNEKGGNVTVGVLTQILSTLLKQSFGLS